MFGIGTKIVCVCDEWICPPEFAKLPKPRKGSLWHVAAERMFDRMYELESQDGHIYMMMPGHEVMLAEITPRTCGFDEAWYCGEYFRPVIVRKTDIGLFNRMLRSVDVPIIGTPAEPRKREKTK